MRVSRRRCSFSHAHFALDQPSDMLQCKYKKGIRVSPVIQYLVHVIYLVLKWCIRGAENFPHCITLNHLFSSQSTLDQPEQINYREIPAAEDRKAETIFQRWFHKGPVEHLLSLPFFSSQMPAEEVCKYHKNSAIGHVLHPCWYWSRGRGSGHLHRGGMSEKSVPIVTSQKRVPADKTSKVQIVQVSLEMLELYHTQQSGFLKS